MNKLKELIQKKELIKKLQEEVKQIEQELLLEGFEQQEVDDYVVKKQIRITFELKPGVDIEEIEFNYPHVIRKTINMKELSKIQDADKLLNIKETEYLTVRKKNANKGK